MQAERPRTSDWGRILDLVAAGLSVPDRLALDYHETLAVRQEVRLRFNSPTAVVAWTLRLGVSSPNSGKMSGDIELFHWLGDDEWELWHMDLRGEPKPDAPASP